MKKRAVLNFIASLLYQIVSLGVGLILPKYYTEIFGSVYNGLNQSIAQIMSLLSVLQFGIAAAAIQEMFKYIATDDKDGIAAIYWNSEKQYRKMGYIFLLIILPIIGLFPFAVKDDIAYHIIVVFLLFRSISAAMEYFFQAKYTIIMTAHNRSYAIYIINIVLLLIGTALHFTILFITKNIIIYQGVALITVLLRLIIVTVYVRKHFPYLQERKNAKIVLEKNSKRRDVLVSEIAGMAIDSTDLLILGIFSGMVSASIYSVYNFVVLGLASVLSSCREAVFAGVGKTYYEDKKEFVRKMDRFESVYLFLAFFLYTTALLLFRPFVENYTKNMDTKYYYVGFPILFLLAKLLVNMRIPSIVAINTAGHFKQVKWYAVIEAVINLTVSLSLVKPLGIYGVLIGTIVAAAFRTPILIWYSNKYILRRNNFSYWKKILCWLPLFGGGYIFSELLPFNCNSLIKWAILAALIAIIMLGTCLLWGIIFDRKLREELKQIFLKIKSKLKKNKGATNE